MQGWPLWAIVLATLVPWAPLFSLEIAWTYRHYHWLALFYLLVLTQGGHVTEHVVQMYQIHVLGIQAREAHGIFGALDVEWVHFLWNSWIIAAVLLLVYRFRGNPWRWTGVAIAGWHEVEHLVIMQIYLTTGKQGTPGLLATGGAIAGGLLPRPDLHFLYNLIETIPLAAGFIYQLKRSYNDWLARALPHLPEELLIETTNELETLRVAEGELVLRQGQPADRFYIIVRGKVDVVWEGEEGDEATVATLGPGQSSARWGCSTTRPAPPPSGRGGPVELLALDQRHFTRLVEQSKATAEELTAVVRARLAAATSYSVADRLLKAFSG